LRILRDQRRRGRGGERESREDGEEFVRLPVHRVPPLENISLPLQEFDFIRNSTAP
jgi:hypothetical protein